MIPAKEFEGELWIKASDYHQIIKEAQREWVGLTDSQIQVMSGNYSESEGFSHGAHWAQDQLKEKNSG